MCDAFIRHPKVEAQGRLEAGKRRRRACRTEEGWDGARGGRAGARERVAGRMEELARREGRRLERDMRDTGGVDRLREQWRWSLLPLPALPRPSPPRPLRACGLSSESTRSAALNAPASSTSQTNTSATWKSAALAWAQPTSPPVAYSSGGCELLNHTVEA